MLLSHTFYNGIPGNWLRKLFVPIFSVVPAKAGTQAAEIFLESFNLHFLIVVRWRSVPREMTMGGGEEKENKQKSLALAWT
jgi:hypothetical protein